MLADYLARFRDRLKGRSERVYLDAFAGEGRGRDRSSGEEFDGSARSPWKPASMRVSPGFGTSRWPKAVELEEKLKADYPGGHQGL